MQNDGYIVGIDRKQAALFPDTIDDYITPDNLVRFIDAFVDMPDLAEMGLTHGEPEEEGRPPYNPGDLFKLFICGYLNHTGSSRKLDRKCDMEPPFQFLPKKPYCRNGWLFLFICD